MIRFIALGTVVHINTSVKKKTCVVFVAFVIRHSFSFLHFLERPTFDVIFELTFEKPVRSSKTKLSERIGGLARFWNELVQCKTNEGENGVDIALIISGTAGIVMAWHLLISPSVEVPFICSSRRSHKSLFSSCQIDVMRVENLERVEASLPKFARNYNSNSKVPTVWLTAICFSSKRPKNWSKKSQSCASCCIKASAVSQPKDFINSRHETGTCNQQQPTAASWATFKTLLTFHYTGCLIGILMMAYYNPHMTG